MALLKDGTRIYGTLYANTAVVTGGINVAPQIQSSFSQANSAFLQANTPSHVANSAGFYANGAFVKANTADINANAASSISASDTDVSSIATPSNFCVYEATALSPSFFTPSKTPCTTVYNAA